MSLLKRDAWKLLCFLLIWFVLKMADGTSDLLGWGVLTVCFLMLKGYLPYMANQTKLITHIKPFILFVILNVIAMSLIWLSLPAWVFSALIALEATLFFLLVMAVLGNHGYSVKPLATHWVKWLIVVAVFYLVQVFLFPLVWSHLSRAAFLLAPLLYIGVTYGLTICKK